MRGATGGAGGCALPLCEHKLCPAASNPALAHMLSQPKGLSLWLAEASEALLLKTGGWGRCFGVGGEFCSPSCMVLIADHMATCAVDIQKLVS